MKLIDKDALVAEIKRIVADETESIKSFEHSKNASEVQRSNARIGMLAHLCSLLDTLEVKEVDLEKAIDDYIYTHDGRKRLALELDWKCCNLTLKGGNEIIKFANISLNLVLKHRKENKYEQGREKSMGVEC